MVFSILIHYLPQENKTENNFYSVISQCKKMMPSLKSGKYSI